MPKYTELRDYNCEHLLPPIWQIVVDYAVTVAKVEPQLSLDMEIDLISTIERMPLNRCHYCMSDPRCARHKHHKHAIVFYRYKKFLDYRKSRIIYVNQISLASVNRLRDSLSHWNGFWTGRSPVQLGPIAIRMPPDVYTTYVGQGFPLVGGKKVDWPVRSILYVVFTLMCYHLFRGWGITPLVLMSLEYLVVNQLLHRYIKFRYKAAAEESAGKINDSAYLLQELNIVLTHRPLYTPQNE